MAPRNRFESEYKANFKPHEVTPVSSRQPQSQIKPNIKEDVPPRAGGIKKKEDLLKPAKAAVKDNPALQYKAGLAPSTKTRDRLRYLSEYKKQFDWKKPLEYEAPILSAEKMIYGVQGDEHPVNASKVKIPKKTEYQLQFVKHPVITTPAEKKELDKNLIEWKEPTVAAGKPSDKQPQQSPPVPKKTMVFQSEYHANFKSPTKYEYIKGAWVGASHPHIPHPDEVSDSEIKPTSNAWYQQVIELREKVRMYRARAREGSYFISLLKNLKENGILETPCDGKKGSSKREVPTETGPKKAFPSEDVRASGGSLGVRPKDVPDKEEQEKQAVVGPPKNKTPSPPPPPTTTITTSKPSQTDHAQNQTLITKPGTDHPTTKIDRELADEKDDVKTSRPALENDDPEDVGKGNLLWNRELDLPGPSLKKTHSVDTISHESTVASTTNLESSPRNQTDARPCRREAWAEGRPTRGLVMPPYGVSSSSATLVESDSRSDVSFSEFEAAAKADDISSPIESKRPVISNATRRLFTGRRQDLNDKKKVDGFSSDDERSFSSYSSKASDVLSVESMEKRRALASETLLRARRRQAQL